MATFTKIEWCDSTWNPVTGCLHGCEYCYARHIANRFKGYDTITIPSKCDKDVEIGGLNVLGVPAKKITKSGKEIIASYPFDFAPTLHQYRLNEPQKWKKPQNIFVCSMADLFGKWVLDSWIEQVFVACEKAPQHNYLFLTKNGKRYLELAEAGKLPKRDNMWYGTSVTTPDSKFFYASEYKTFLSIEPILEFFPHNYVQQMERTKTNWIIVGAETGSRKDKVVPKVNWIKSIAHVCDGAKIPLFMKDSLVPIVGEENMRREFPEKLQE